jgi:hypothetical protein
MPYSKKVATKGSALDVWVGGDDLPHRKKDRTVQARVKRFRTNKLIEQASTLRTGERQCTAVKKTGVRCKKYAIKGGFVCPTHGGSAPQVRAKANKRLLALVEPSLIRLGDLVQQSEHMPTALGAIRTVLERAGTITPIGPLGKDTNEGNSRPIINIGIALGGLTPDKMRLLAQAQLSDPTVIDATVEEDDDSDE